ncbi:MAG: protein DpdG [Oxalobacteraceae bacterium]|nr:protein DpdG [Oxalobacteraceae bacterium]
MSLLNLTVDGLPNVLIVLYSTVALARSPLTIDEVLNAVAPPGVVTDPRRIARVTFNRWTELGLFRLDDAGERVMLARAPETDMKNDVDIVRAVRIAARRCALSESNNPELWARESALAADLTRSLAWLLAQDVYRLRFSEAQSLELKQIANDDLRLMQNDTRKNGLQFWGHFLGFVRQPGGGDVDPTLAIRETLPACIDVGEDMPATEFVERLAKHLPVLDGGAYRVAVEAQLENDALPPLQSGQLSTSLSRALFSLMIDQTLQFENKADVGSSIVLTGHDGLRADQRYSWVRRPRRAV